MKIIQVENAFKVTVYKMHIIENMNSFKCFLV